MPINPVDHRELLASAIFAGTTCRAARRGRLRPLRRRETGKDFLRLLSPTIGAGQRISSLIHFLDLLKDLSALSTLIFINRHGFLLNVKFQNPNVNSNPKFKCRKVKSTQVEIFEMGALTFI